jgi:hypothetical protein
MLLPFTLDRGRNHRRSGLVGVHRVHGEGSFPEWLRWFQERSN